MPIKFVCPLCKHKVKVSRKDAGTHRGCPACNETIPVPALKTAPEVEWDENSDKPPPPPFPGKQTAELIALYSAGTPPAEAKPEPPPAAKRLPSAGRVKRPPLPGEEARERARQRLAIVVLAGVGAVFLGGTAFIFLRKPPPPKETTTETTAAVVTATVNPDPTLKKDPELEAAYALVIEARAKENAGAELEAEVMLDQAIDPARSLEARRTLIAARRAFLDRCRTTVLQVCADVKFKALGGHSDDAQKVLNDYFPHVPRTLHEELFHEIDALNEELLARLPRERPRMRASRKAKPTDTGVADERGKFERLEEGLHDAVLALDADAAQKAIGDAGTFSAPDLAASAERQTTCALAALQVALAARERLDGAVGKNLELALWKGRASGKLTKIEGNVLSLELPIGGMREIGLAELSAAALAFFLKPASPAETERQQFGLGVLCMVHGDLAGACEHLKGAPSIETAVALARTLEKDEPATPKPTPVTPTTPDPTPPRPGSGDVTEKWPNGNPKKHYSRDEKGRTLGLCVEYSEDGKPRVQSHWQAGEMHGEYVELWPNGKPSMKTTYRKGKLHGEVVYYDQAGKVTQRTSFTDGKLLASKTVDEIRRDLDAIASAPIAFPSRPASASEFAPLDWESQARALRRLRGYRYLCGVPHDVGLSWEYSEYCTAGAQLLGLIGRLDHTPDKPPGCPDLLYQLGYTGTSKGNLHSNTAGTNAVEAVDGFMDDSDKDNIDRVGHRRWCLNPSMALTAFGVKGNYAVMYAHDGGHPTPADRVAYPAAGYFPASFVHPDLAWSVSFDASKYKPPASGDLKIVVSTADEKYRKIDPVVVEDVTINTGGFGMALCLIFRPKGRLTAGARYWVEIRGFKAGGEDAPIEYYVEFF